MPSRRPLARSFFNRDPRLVARDLLGKLLVRRARGAAMEGRIVEVEAYLGAGDAAAHSAAGRTARNAVLWGPPGHAYVYFIYGNYYCLNVSCLPDGDAGCILIRALEPTAGLTAMARNRRLDWTEDAPLTQLRLLTSGPGRLCQAFAITRERDNGADVTGPRSSLYIASDRLPPPRVVVSRRVGITKAADHLLRYSIAGNPFVSDPRP